MTTQSSILNNRQKTIIEKIWIHINEKQALAYHKVKHSDHTAKPSRGVVEILFSLTGK